MRIFSLLSILLSLTTFLQAQSIDGNFKLAAFFPFTDCKVEDASSNSNQASGGVLGTVECACGVRDQSLRLSGSLDRILMVGPVAKVFETGDFTVSFYFKPFNPPPDSIGITQMVLSKQADCTRNNAFWVRYRRKGQNSSNSNVISAGISESDNLFANLSYKLPDDRCWYHIVLVREGTTFEMFVDGVSVAKETTNTRVDLTNTATLSVGDPVCPTDGPLFAYMDEMRFYNRAYDAQEIAKFLTLNPDRIVNNDTLIYIGAGFQALTSQTCADDFVWEPAAGVSDLYAANPTLSPTELTTYQLRFQHPDGCAAFDTIRVKVIDPDTLDCEKVFVPNAFTPASSAGRNDVFGISNPFVVADIIAFEVYDRWGGRVFSAETAFDTWDGTFKDKPLNPGVFLYVLRYRCKGQELVKTGTVTLIR
jgi:gliding motility-associated-like protein